MATLDEQMMAEIRNRLAQGDTEEKPKKKVVRKKTEGAPAKAASAAKQPAKATAPTKVATKTATKAPAAGTSARGAGASCVAGSAGAETTSGPQAARTAKRLDAKMALKCFCMSWSPRIVT
jgi:hypothetical protein